MKKPIAIVSLESIVCGYKKPKKVINDLFAVEQKLGQKYSKDSKSVTVVFALRGAFFLLLSVARVAKSGFVLSKRRPENGQK